MSSTLCESIHLGNLEQGTATLIYNFLRINEWLQIELTNPTNVQEKNEVQVRNKQFLWSRLITAPNRLHNNAATTTDLLRLLENMQIGGAVRE